MRRRHPVLWLMTDERVGEALWPTLEALPRGSGVIFRHYTTPVEQRRRMFARALAVARRRGLILVRAGDLPFRGEMGMHGSGRAVRPGIRTWSAHSRREAIAGLRAGADVILVSPIFDTRSHADARPLGVLRAATVAHGLPHAVALGGMTDARFRRARGLGFSGWAAIDALVCQPHQKRNAVPT